MKKPTMSPTVAKSAKVYAAGLIEACRRGGDVNPVKVLTDTADYPRIQKMEMVEWIIGWFNGLADVLDMPVDKLWAEAITPSIKRPVRVPRPAKHSLAQKELR